MRLILSSRPRAIARAPSTGKHNRRASFLCKSIHTRFLTMWHQHHSPGSYVRSRSECVTLLIGCVTQLLYHKYISVSLDNGVQNCNCVITSIEIFCVHTMFVF